MHFLFAEVLVCSSPSRSETAERTFAWVLYGSKRRRSKKRVSFEAALMPEVGLLETLHCLFDRDCVLHKSVHLGHWPGISECGHFPQCIVRPGARGMMRRRVYSVLSDLLFYLFWLFFCCRVNFGLCALRCKHKVFNRLLLLRKLPLFSPSLFTHAHTLLSFVVFSVFPWSPLLCPWSCCYELIAFVCVIVGNAM